MVQHLLQPQVTYSSTINTTTPLIFTYFICLGLRVTVELNYKDLDIFTDNNSSYRCCYRLKMILESGNEETENRKLVLVLRKHL